MKELESPFFLQTSSEDQFRANVIFGLNFSILAIYLPLALYLLIARGSRLHFTAKILMIAFIISFLSKVFADTRRAFFSDIILSSTVISIIVVTDALQSLVIYIFVLNIGILKEKYLAQTPKEFKGRLRQIF